MNISELDGITVEKHKELLDSGMFWVYFPEATGDYTQDMKLAKDALIKRNQKEGSVNITAQGKPKKYKWVDAGYTTKALVKGDVIKIKAGKGYWIDGETLVKLQDNKDSLNVKFPSTLFGVVRRTLI